MFNYRLHYNAAYLKKYIETNRNIYSIYKVYKINLNFIYILFQDEMIKNR